MTKWTTNVQKTLKPQEKLQSPS